MKKCILIIALFGGIFLSSFSQIDYKGFPEWSWHKEGTTEYYLYTPKNLIPGQKYPIALFMHGCCGKDYVATLRNAVDPPVRMWHNFGENEQTVPMYIISPATSSGWSQHFANLKKVMDDLVATKQGDPQRIYVTGFSMGGRGTWDFINTYPNYFAAALPMGMDFSGDVQNAKNIPIWTNRGSLDDYCKTLPASVTAIRAANGDTRNAAYSWEKGINPVFTDFIGVGHGVQWDATSTQDLVGWALTKINDGNIYPNVYFKSPSYKQVFTTNRVAVEITAGDNDGTITKVELAVNGILQSTLNVAPYKDSATLHAGDNVLKAIAYDDKGKTSTSFLIVRMDNHPMLITSALPAARQGAIYMKQLFANGNGPFTFSASKRYGALPQGVVMQTNGLIKGIPTVTGSFNIGVVVTDEDKDSIVVPMTLKVNAKNSNEILVTNAKTTPYNAILVSKMMKGELPNTDAGNEINLSNVNKYAGLTAIFPSVQGASNSAANYMTFDISDDAIVHVAYEKMDCTLTTTIPTWLKSYTKDHSTELTAQYRYFDVYSKSFTKGSVVLPGADNSVNGVSSNYFVMVQKSGVINNTKPQPQEITHLTAYIGQEFKEQVSALDGEGNMAWSLVSGALPLGMTFSKKGLIQGFPTNKGDYTFTLKVKDANGDSTSTAFTISVKDFMHPIHVLLKDTMVMKNSGTITIPLNSVTNGISPVQNVTIQVKAADTNLISLTNAVKVSGNNYTFSLTPKLNKVGTTYVHVKIKDNNNADTLTNTSEDVFKVSVVSSANEPPTCDSIPDQWVYADNSKRTITFTGVSDGNGTNQAITASVVASNLNVTSTLSWSYKTGNTSGTISYYPINTGTSTLTLTLKDNGGTNLGGQDTKKLSFVVKVVGQDLKEEEQKISLFPNPVTEKLMIRLDPAEYNAFTITDATGKTWISKNITSDEMEINTALMPSGSYCVNISGRAGKVVKKFVKVE